MLIALHLFALPLAYIFWIVFLFATGRRKGLLISLALFVCALAAGGWSVVQSSASTDGIGFLLLPYVATFAGVLGLAFAYGWSSGRRWPRIGGRVALTIAVLLITVEVLLAGR
jgi:hypothetical protein